MIKAKVVSVTINEAIGGVTKLDLETYLEDKVDLNSFYAGMDFDGLDAVIMTKEEYEAMDSVSDVLRKSLLEKKEDTRKLKEENKKLKSENNEKEGEICKLIVANKDLEEKLAQEAGEVDLCPDGTIVFRKKRVSELEKEVEKLEKEIEDLKEENKTLKKRIDIAMDFVDEVCSEVKELFDE